LFVVATGWLGGRIPVGFLPDEDQGFLYANLSLPNAASLERTDNAAKKVEEILMHTPGVEKVTSISGFSLLSTVYSTYNGFFFVTLKPWEERTNPEEHIEHIKASANRALASVPVLFYLVERFSGNKETPGARESGAQEEVSKEAGAGTN
jgi:HAE1 family hydrophobic/amphiphilic exporter-1